MKAEIAMILDRSKKYSAKDGSGVSDSDSQQRFCIASQKAVRKKHSMTYSALGHVPTLPIFRLCMGKSIHKSASSQN
jgi:hypothetical protein